MLPEYDIISSGSKGNAVVLNGTVLVDCGVPFKMLKPHVPKLQIVLLTHIHGDHFNAATIRRLAQERPSLRFAACEWMISPLVDAGVRPANVDVLFDGLLYKYSGFSISPFVLTHDVPNCGYKISFRSAESRVFYATDTLNLNGISAKGYDLYLIEGNYSDDEIRQRISDKKVNGEYAYEYRVMKYHQSKASCDDWLARNMTGNSYFIYMHEHALMHEAL
ncbi:MAG: MBL fold metallo-hydrolase [bacterium]|nr:MBL fold metallo-hydrolase [bacterium]